MADFVISTTAEFDAGIKSLSDGNHQVETESDNPSIPSDQFQLGNYFGEGFNVADADHDTWRWSNNDIGPQANVGSFSPDINTTTPGKSHITATRVGVRVFGTVNIAGKMTGAFDIRWNLAKAATGANSGSQVRIGMADTASDYAYFALHEPGADGVSQFLFQSFNGSSFQTDVLAITDRDISARITRDGAGLLRVFYDLAGGDSWTEWVAASRSAMGSFDWFPFLSVVGSNLGGSVVTGDYDNFRVDVGTFIGNDHQLSGFIETPEEPMTGVNLQDTTITHSGLDASNFIDRIEWLVGGIVKATFITDITSGASTLITTPTSGSFAAVNADFTIRTFLVGDGTSTPVVTQLEGDFVFAAGVIRNLIRESPNVGLLLIGEMD